jgi:signal transduction histidine kinase
VLTAVLVVAGVVLAAAEPTGTTIAYAAFGAAVAPVWAAVGVMVARAARRNVIGALLALIGLGLAFTATREVAERVLVRHPHALAQLDWLAALSSESSIWVLAALALLLLLFPEGRVPGPRWRPVPPLLLATALIHHAYGAVDPAPFPPPLQHMRHPFGVAPLALQLPAFVADLALFALLLACTVAPLRRYRHAGERRRRQLKWLALAGLGVPGFIVACLLELRKLAHGLRPRSLDDGLHAALAGLTRQVPIPVALDVHAEPLPDDVATTAFYVASEAIANAVKHAGATRIDVRIARCDGHVEVRVADDGRGGARLCPGFGLAGLSDRASAIGGVLALDSERGRGTTVEAVVPCGS